MVPETTLSFTPPKDVQGFDQTRAEKNDQRQEKFFLIIIRAAYTQQYNSSLTWLNS